MHAVGPSAAGTNPVLTASGATQVTPQSGAERPLPIHQPAAACPPPTGDPTSTSSQASTTASAVGIRSLNTGGPDQSDWASGGVQVAAQVLKKDVAFLDLSINQ